MTTTASPASSDPPPGPAAGPSPGPPSGPPPVGQPSGPLTRIGFVAALVLLAVLLVVSAGSAPAVEDPRLGRRVELIGLIRAEQARAAALGVRVEELSDELSTLQRAEPRHGRIELLEGQIGDIGAYAGMTAVRGPGLRVVLSDSGLANAPSGDPNDLVVHEQDLQAAINALWGGGAEAMSVQGHRVLATTAIRCVGNTLLLHGVVYSPPYVIEAVGDPAAMRAALAEDPAVERFRQGVRELQLGLQVDVREDLVVPAYEGVTAMQVARPAEDT
jgi:uncharacterized protein YlxW (UPF0749 family)